MGLSEASLGRLYFMEANSMEDLREDLFEQIKISAKCVVEDVCKIRPDERVLIITNRVVERPSICWKNQEISFEVAQAEFISQALYDACEAVGAKVSMATQPTKSSMDAADESVIAALKTEPDVCFSISHNKLGKDVAAISNPYKDEAGNSFDHIFDYLLYGKKTMRSAWTPGITLDMFGRTVGIDYQQLQQRCKTLCDLYQNVATVEIKAPAGTDLVIPVDGRKPFSDDGDFSRPGSGGNVPAGEVFISPVVGDGKESGCRGRIAFDGSMSVNVGCVAIKTPIVVDVAGGFISNISGGDEAQKLLDTITQAEEEALAMGKDGRLSTEDAQLYCRNARNIGELGIGLNPTATITGNMLEDEKAFRTCHIAIGENYDNDAHALIHLDGVIRNPTIDFVYTDGSRRRILEDGVLTF